MSNLNKSKAEERFAEIKKRDREIKNEVEIASRLRTEKSIKLKQLRLSKEAEDMAAKQAAKSLKKGDKTVSQK